MHFCTVMKAKVVSLFNTRKGPHTFTRAYSKASMLLLIFLLLLLQLLTLSALYIELRGNIETCGKSLKALNTYKQLQAGAPSCSLDAARFMLGVPRCLS